MTTETLGETILREKREIAKLENTLVEKYPELQKLIALKNAVEQDISDYKQMLKDTHESGTVIVKDVAGGELIAKVGERVTLSVENPDLIPDEFKEEQELPNAYIKNGKVYTREVNLPLIKSQRALGVDCPEGVVEKHIKTISLTLNGDRI